MNRDKIPGSKVCSEILINKTRQRITASQRFQRHIRYIYIVWISFSCNPWLLMFFLSTGPGQHMHGRVRFRLSPKTWLAWALWIWKPIAHNALQTERPKSLLELFHVPKSLLDKIPWDWESRACRTFIFDSKGIRQIKFRYNPNI